jgi:hypothetical protein
VIDGIKHVLEKKRWERAMARRADTTEVACERPDERGTTT